EDPYCFWGMELPWWLVGTAISMPPTVLGAVVLDGREISAHRLCAAWFSWGSACLICMALLRGSTFQPYQLVAFLWPACATQEMYRDLHTQYLCMAMISSLWVGPAALSGAVAYCLWVWRFGERADEESIRRSPPGSGSRSTS